MENLTGRDSAGIPTVLIMRDGLFREGLECLLSKTQYDVRCDDLAPAGDQATFADIPEAGPVVILIESEADDPDSLSRMAAVRARCANGKIVVIATRPGRAHLNDCLRGGANGYLLAGSTLSRLLDTIHLVLHGQTVFPAEYGLTFGDDDQAGGADPAEPSARHVLGRMSGKDRQVLHMLVAGMSNKEMGRHLRMPEPSVKVLLYKVLRNIGVENRVQGAVWAVNNGFSPYDPGAESDDASSFAAAG